MKVQSSLDQYKDLFLIPSNDGSFDMSAFKQTAHTHASNTHSGSAPELPGDVMHELAEILGGSPLNVLSSSAHGHGYGHGHSHAHGPTLDDFGDAIKGGKSGGGNGGGNGGDHGKGHGGGGTTTTDSGGTTTTDSGGTTTDSGGTTTDSGGTTTTVDTSSPPPSYVVPALTSGYSWGHGPITIKYDFLQSLPSYYASTDTEASHFSAFNATQMAAAQHVLDMISQLVDVTFVETTNVAESQITFGNSYLGSGIGAWTYYPYTSSPGTKAGDLWVNSQYSYNLSPSPGNYADLTLIHELGHAMGLKHDFEGSYVLPSTEDNRMFTVMSYHSDPLMSGVEPQTYMLDDVATLQSLYGANYSTGAGDNTYSFLGANNLLETIWDSGGNDMFDCSGLLTSVSLNLNGGSFSSIGTLGGSSLAQNNVAIAYNCTIENASGGSGNDLIVGNYANNILSGGAGNDTMTGGDGTDTFVFALGDGADTITDFVHGTDVMDLRSMGVTASDVHISDGAAGAVVQVADVSITLTGVTASQIDSHDFLFT